MRDIFSLFEKPQEEKEFDVLKIVISSPEAIKNAAFGEVKNPETINYRTFKPEKTGCSREDLRAHQGLRVPLREV